MSADEVRTRLAALQTELVRTPTQQSAPPNGFDPARLEATAAALLSKRTRAVARTWPALARSLGQEFDQQFAAFAARTPLPRTGGPLADGRAFARALARVGRLADEARVETMRVDLHYASCAGGLRPRRGPGLAVAVLPQARRLLLAVRWPWLGEKWLSIPLPIRPFWGRERSPRTAQ